MHACICCLRALPKHSVDTSSRLAIFDVCLLGEVHADDFESHHDNQPQQSGPREHHAPIWSTHLQYGPGPAAAQPFQGPRSAPGACSAGVKARGNNSSMEQHITGQSQPSTVPTTRVLHCSPTLPHNQMVKWGWTITHQQGTPTSVRVVSAD
jgi:hypothetical protein